MASEYVSFMMVFGLGITMVVAVAFTMDTLTNSVYDTSADVELNRILNEMKNDILDGLKGSNNWNGQVDYQISLDLPQLLANRFEYSITVDVVNNYYILTAQVSSINVNKEVSVELWLSTNDFSLSGSLISIKTNPVINIQRDLTGTVSITLTNNGA